MNATGDPRIDRIAASPVYQELKQKRNRLGWTLTILMLIAYFGYIGLIAFDKSFLRSRSATASARSVFQSRSA